MISASAISTSGILTPAAIDPALLALGLRDLAYGLLIGFLIGVLVAAGWWLMRRIRRNRGRGPEIHAFISIEEMRAIGELSVFKVVTKEIVTARDHWAGSFGKRYLQWLTSSRKMAMIFEFDIDFRYDLRDPEFVIEQTDPGAFRLKMPPCRYEIHIRDINFYDEQRSRLLPWLLPDLVNQVMQGGFDEEDKNHLKEEARQQATQLAEGLVQRLRSEVQASARETITAIARGFAAEHVEVDFRDIAPQQLSVSYEATNAPGPSAGPGGGADASNQ
jgi:hypothetical protein